MLAEPEGIESQFLRPFTHRQNFLVVLLVGPTDLGGIIAEYENAKFHKDSSFVPGILSLAMISNAVGAPDDRSYPKTREISTWTAGSDPVWFSDSWESTVCILRKDFNLNLKGFTHFREAKFGYGRTEKNR